MNGIFVDCFGSIEDPRVERTKKHVLLDIIALGLCGVLAGAEGWEEIEDYGHLHEGWFNQFLDLPNGIPSHDTISRVFSALDGKALQSSSIQWLKRIQTLFPETVIPIDGKTLRGSKRGVEKALHVINAWSCANGMSLGQLKVDGKSNEITAVPEILKQLFIKGAIVTLDAMGCQEETVRQIIEAQADYVIALKGNQGCLHETVKDSFKLYDKGSKVLSVERAELEIEGSHGRIEQRQIEVIDTALLEGVLDKRWTKLASIIRVIYTREESVECVREARFYISSLSAVRALTILQSIRSHWEVENCLHWSLDVTFREDNCRIRDENAALNLSWLRKLALGLLKNEKVFKKMSMRRKQRKLLVEPAHLLNIFKSI
jgi:predicted transposase YbfD/YdcC